MSPPDRWGCRRVLNLPTDTHWQRWDLTWVRLISIYLLTLLAIHQLYGNHNDVCNDVHTSLHTSPHQQPHVVAGRLTRVEMVLCKHWFLGLLVPGWLLAALLSAWFPGRPPSHTNFHPLTLVWTNPHPHPCTSAASAPEIAAHDAPGLQDLPPFLQNCGSPAPALLGSLGRQPAGWGGCAENLRCFPFLGRKPNCSLLEFYKLCAQRRFHLGRKKKKNILHLLSELGWRNQGLTAHIWPNLLCLQISPCSRGTAGKTTEQPAVLCSPVPVYFPSSCSSLGLGLGFLGLQDSWERWAIMISLCTHLAHPLPTCSTPQSPTQGSWPGNTTSRKPLLGPESWVRLFPSDSHSTQYSSPCIIDLATS